MTDTDTQTLHNALEAEIEGEVRFDKISRALYSTDASVYQMEPLGVVVAASREDIISTVQLCHRHRCPLTLRGGGTSQAGQAVGHGLQLDTSKHLNRLLEVNTAEGWARVEPGIILDDLNDLLKPRGFQFGVDISSSSRATLGGMIANNSSGARSVLYGLTADNVQQLDVVFSDGSEATLRPLTAGELEAKCATDTLEAEGCRTLRRLAQECREEIENRYPKVLRRVMGYNLEPFANPEKPFDLTKLIIGSEGTLAVILEARIKLVPLPKAKAVITIEFPDLLDALAATPRILEHSPSAIEVMDRFILDHTRNSPELAELRSKVIDGDPGGLLCVEFYADRAEDLPPRLEALERDLAEQGIECTHRRVTDPAAQKRVWSLRQSGLGLSMAMKGDAKSIPFVEDTAVAPERLRDFIERFLGIVRGHGTKAGVYAHASVGCLHVRPVVNLKTEDGVKQFEAIANGIADLVLEYGGALSGEHGDGMVRGPFIQKMLGPVLYEAFRKIKRSFDPRGILNPGKIVDTPPLTDNLRYGAAYETPDHPSAFFDYSDFGGMGRAVEMCSGVGKCRKKLAGTMCPSYMATLEEAHSTRGRANVLRLAMGGELGETGLGDEGVYDVMKLCLECRACRSECPTSVDMARFKSEFLADYWTRHPQPWRSRVAGNIGELARWGSRLTPFSNVLLRSAPSRWMAEKLTGVDRRRAMPAFARQTFAQWFAGHGNGQPQVFLFNDTFTNHYHPSVGRAAVEVLEAAGVRVGLAPNVCCGRPLISQGMLAKAREQARANAELLFPLASAGKKILFCEPSCLSVLREDAPDLLRGEEREKARVVGQACLSVEEFLRDLQLDLRSGPKTVLLHGHCHQKAMGLLPPAIALLSRIPGATVEDLDAGCCGMAGSFGYAKDNYEVSRRIAERKLLPAARRRDAETVLVAAGVSCRQQVEHHTGTAPLHPVELIRSLLGINT